ncbi:hypothetical protein L6452_02253 [Arctium lappa]|uniref:Uncharacterized protein n=1 Tax=Arctium lappa TaxID=4217 RepID=A0ACB9FJ34_ARCLA|nr:hypothetical protein L6452_02253 [Arctium lappa]
MTEPHTEACVAYVTLKRTTQDCPEQFVSIHNDEEVLEQPPSPLPTTPVEDSGSPLSVDGAGTFVESFSSEDIRGSDGNPEEPITKISSLGVLGTGTKFGSCVEPEVIPSYSFVTNAEFQAIADHMKTSITE